MAPFNMLNEIFYLLVQGEILEVLMKLRRELSKR